MKILDLASVQPGERLACAISNQEGKLLFPQGEVLTPNVLRALQQWGITSIAVLSDDASGPQGQKASSQGQQAPQGQKASSQGQQTQKAQGAAHPEDLLQAVKDVVQDRFRLLDMENEHIKAIFELAVERHGRMMLSKSGKMDLSGNSSPAFQTQRPPQVNMRTLIDSSQRMGTLPVVFHRLVEIINDPQASPESISKIVSMDPALSVRLLRLANSPFYAFASRIDSIPRAVAMVGTRQLVMLAMGATLITAFKGVPVSLVNMQSFWAHSISCGATARQFSLLDKTQSSDSFFVIGLLHDISRLLIYSLLPNHTLYILTEAKRRQESVHSLEKETLGFGHEDLGAELLNMWHCPADLVQRVYEHHAPLRADASLDDLMLPLANSLSQALGFGSSGETYIPPLPNFVWSKLGITPNHLLEQCRVLDEKVKELRTLLTPA